MSTVAFRAMLIREINQAMSRAQDGSYRFLIEGGDDDYLDGQMDAYAHILTLIMDEDL